MGDIPYIFGLKSSNKIEIQGQPNTLSFGKRLKKKTTEYLKVQSSQLIMENIFFQMAASAGHTVAYTIGPNF